MNYFDLYKKTIPLSISGVDLLFDVAQELFSSYQIDLGTQRLLRSLLTDREGALPPELFKKVLDIGCGYGPIGITIGKIFPESILHMVDVDALALEFTKHNARKNGVVIENVFPSLGVSKVEDNDYTLIISNIPATIGSEAIREMLLTPVNYLAEGGRVAVVVIDEITQEVYETLTAQCEIQFQRSWNGHTVYIYSYPEGFTHKERDPLAPYLKKAEEFRYENISYKLSEAINLYTAEETAGLMQLMFDELSRYTTHTDGAVGFYNSGPGHIPLYTTHLLDKNAEIYLYDTNLLALEVADHNLRKERIRAEKVHTHFISDSEVKHDLLVLLINEQLDESKAADRMNDILDSLDDTGHAMCGASSTTITRMMESAGDRIREMSRGKSRGLSVVRFRKS